MPDRRFELLFPRTVHEEGNIAIQEHGFGGGGIEVIRQNSSFFHLSHFAKFDHTFGTDTNIRGVVSSWHSHQRHNRPVRSSRDRHRSATQNDAVLNLFGVDEFFGEIIDTLGGEDFCNQVGIVEKAQASRARACCRLPS